MTIQNNNSNIQLQLIRPQEWRINHRQRQDHQLASRSPQMLMGMIVKLEMSLSMSALIKMATIR